MKTLKLVIKQMYFDQILSGEKKVESREIKPTTASRYIYYVNVDTDKEYAPKEMATAPESKGGYEIYPVEYDALELFVGYNTNRPSLVVEITDYSIVFLEDEDGNPITYEVNGETYQSAIIEYSLGKILSRKNC